MYAHLSNELSTTDWLSLHFLHITNLCMFVSSPIVTARFSKVFTNFYEETARIGRKVSTNGLITYDCAEVIAKNAMIRFFLTLFLIAMITLSDIMFGFMYLNQMSASLNVDFGLSYHFLFMSIPALFTVVYPPCIMVMEVSLLFSMDFSVAALKKWSQDFKKDIETVKSKLALNKNDSNLEILCRSK